MLKFKKVIRHKTRKISTLIIFFLISFSFLFFLTINNNNNINEFYYSNNKKSTNTNLSPDEDKSPKTSAVWAYLNLTDINNVNNSRYYHNTTIPVRGFLLNTTSDPIPDYTVSLYIDGNLESAYNVKTNNTGGFLINYTIPFSMNIYSDHKIEANVTDLIIPGLVILVNYLNISANATSYFDTYGLDQFIPQIPGQNIREPCYLRYGLNNNSGIPNKQVDYYWENESLEKWPMNNFFTLFDGSFPNIFIPDDYVSETLALNLTYIENIPYINGTQKIILVNLYRGVACVWNTEDKATEGDDITIRGRLSSNTNPNLKINYTELVIRFNGASIGSVTTDANGNFAHTYEIPEGSEGDNNILVEITNGGGVSSNAHTISVEEASEEDVKDVGEDDDDEEETPAPYYNFSLVFFPILAGIIAGLSIYIYFFIRKQKKASLISHIPLEGKIRNLKILKDTGRLEESLSYLFNAIYMELVDGKYGRRKIPNETIREFAIISVKEFSLNPHTIYPFIQNIEAIIYDKPFKITDKHFYESVELFSPIYYELTGYNFVLNF